jgi:hypothetical protein
LFNAVVGTPRTLKLEVDSKYEKYMVKWRGFDKDAEWECKK